MGFEPIFGHSVSFSGTGLQALTKTNRMAKNRLKDHTGGKNKVRRFLFKSIHFHRLKKQSLFSRYKSLQICKSLESRNNAIYQLIQGYSYIELGLPVVHGSKSNCYQGFP